MTDVTIRLTMDKLRFSCRASNCSNAKVWLSDHTLPGKPLFAAMGNTSARFCHPSNCMMTQHFHVTVHSPDPLPTPRHTRPPIYFQNGVAGTFLRNRRKHYGRAC